MLIFLKLRYQQGLHLCTLHSIHLGNTKQLLQRVHRERSSEARRFIQFGYQNQILRKTRQQERRQQQSLGTLCVFCFLYSLNILHLPKPIYCNLYLVVRLYEVVPFVNPKRNSCHIDHHDLICFRTCCIYIEPLFPQD